MKNLIFAALILLSCSVYSNDTVQVVTPVNSTVIYNDVKDAITQLADALKTTADHVWVVLLKQQYVIGVMYLFVYVLFVVFLGLFVYCLKTGKWDRYYMPDTKAVLSIIFGILAFAFFIAGIAVFKAVLTAFLNPEFGAMNQIFNLIK